MLGLCGYALGRFQRNPSHLFISRATSKISSSTVVIFVCPFTSSLVTSQHGDLKLLLKAVLSKLDVQAMCNISPSLLLLYIYLTSPIIRASQLLFMGLSSVKTRHANKYIKFQFIAFV